MMIQGKILQSVSLFLSQPWNAFGEPSKDISSMGIKQNDVLLAAAPVHPSTSEKYLALEVSSVLHPSEIKCSCSSNGFLNDI